MAGTPDKQARGTRRRQRAAVPVPAMDASAPADAGAPGAHPGASSISPDTAGPSAQPRAPRRRPATGAHAVRSRSGTAAKAADKTAERYAPTETALPERRLRAAIDALSDQLYILDLASARFVDANRTAVRMSGYSHGEIGGFGPERLTALSPEASRAFCETVVAAGGARGTQRGDRPQP